MVRSMTGYGSADAQTGAGRFVVEMRSVNHRFGEVLVRLPRDLAPLEDAVRTAVQARALRGRVEVTIMREERGVRPKTIRPDADLAVAYAQALTELARVLGVPGEVGLPQIAAFPDVIRVEETREDLQALWPQLSGGVETALAALVGMREAEGQRLAADMLVRADRAAARVAEIAARSHSVVADYAARLRDRIDELVGAVPVDEGRLMTEVAVFAERSDVTEELTRLGSHLVQFQEDVAAVAGPVGRKLDFVLQEMSREANTVGSKANDLEISRAVIAIKGELESLREQVQNIE